MVNKWAKGIALIVGAMGGLTAQATILPPNDLHLEDNMMLDSNITEAEFNKIIDQVEKYARPLVTRHGGVLKVNRKWSDTTVNASASQIGKNWEINMYGGLARRPEVTPDAFTVVMCHELGHHLGGFPLVSSWAANEGQSDYYATMSCARELWKNQLTRNRQAAQEVEASAKALCDKAWTKEADRNLCYRTMMAGRSVAELMAAGGSVSFSTPDKTKVTATYHKHPKAQCRLDTYMSGALCVKRFNTGVITKDEASSNKSACTVALATYYAARPRCWYKPAKASTTTDPWITHQFEENEEMAEEEAMMDMGY